MSVKPTDLYGIDARTGDVWINLERRGWRNMGRWTGDAFTFDEVPASVQPADPATVLGNDVEGKR